MSVSICKNCYHESAYHIEAQDVCTGFIFKFIGKPSGCTVGPWCKCKLLIVDDNLTYIEELAKARGLV